VSDVVGEIVTHKAVKLVSCSRCGRGKKLRRTKTFTWTLELGDTREAVLAWLRDCAEEWPFTAAHPPCQCLYFTDQQ